MRRAGLLLRRVRARLRCNRGQTLVEFAVVLPILLLLLLGILDFGRAVNDWNDATHVANLAARYAAVGTLPTYGKCGTNANPGESLTAFVTCEVGIDSPQLQTGSNGGNGPSAVQVCISAPNGWTSQSDVQVQVTTQYKWLPFLNLATSPIHGSATQMIENTTPQQSGWGAQSGTC